MYVEIWAIDGIFLQICLLIKFTQYINMYF